MSGKSPFQAFLHRAAAANLLVLLLCIPFWHIAVLESLGITALTVFYHLAVRLFLGEWLLMRLIPAHPDWHARRYRVSPWEQALYERLGVKRWKRSMPTYDPAEYSGSLDHIIEATCRSETVHLCNVPASFLPLLFSLAFGAFPVFLLTSLAAAALDLAFVIVQRYNRPRLIRAYEKQTARRAVR